ncbi:hypothetical protein G647_00802 [Cladophialophora carrionii CBS 160.54]|uniref:Uncharacterized protein n=1 Tax=Cladophialophora carrionii CBS 160.54 TaxID=1279043 RepID=V9DPW6_9EURO|nr:uncharacterized protein G647_00802 [Cladophialophora carrionii CBS 160.54]ETI28353.1 hypothetical protein G647_00802 [Cladophialophora carrionii CBS 160.54]
MTRPSAPPARRNGTGILFALIFAILSVCAVYALRIASVQSGIADKMERITTTHRFLEHPLSLRTTYTGIAPVDQGLTFLVTAFMNAASGWDAGFFVFLGYFLVSFFAILTVWAVESCRERNGRALTRFTYIYALLYQTVGGAVIVPIYYLVYLYDTSSNSYWSKPRNIPLPYAKALLPALIIGYLIPTGLIFLPYSAPDMWTTQAAVAFWQPSPWYVDILIWVFAKLYSGRSSTKSSPSNRNSDILHLNRIYLTSFLVTGMLHLFIIYLILFSPNSEHSFSHMFLDPFSYSSTQMSMVQGMHGIFLADFWIIFASSLLWAYLALWDLKRVKLADVNLWSVGILLAIGTVAVGPGAVVTGVWYWREKQLTGQEKEKEKEKAR